MVPSSSCKRNFEFTQRSWAGGYESFQRFLETVHWFRLVWEWEDSGTVLRFRKVPRRVPWLLMTTLSCYIVYTEKFTLRHDNQFSWLFPSTRKRRFKLHHTSQTPPRLKLRRQHVHFEYDQFYDQRIVFIWYK